jgi:hypothetical protein
MSGLPQNAWLKTKKFGEPACIAGLREPGTLSAQLIR